MPFEIYNEDGEYVGYYNEKYNEIRDSKLNKERKNTGLGRATEVASLKLGKNAPMNSNVVGSNTQTRVGVVNRPDLSTVEENTEEGRRRRKAGNV